MGAWVGSNGRWFLGLRITSRSAATGARRRSSFSEEDDPVYLLLVRQFCVSDGGRVCAFVEKVGELIGRDLISERPGPKPAGLKDADGT